MEHYINVKTLLGENCKGSLSDAIQNIIDQNPNRTIFFPDGEYVLDKSLVTSSDPKKSVCLKLSDYALLSVANGWPKKQPIICIGGKDFVNNIETPGSNFGIEGGILDCGGVATGISLDSGRETYIRYTSIKNAVIGIHIKNGINNGSADADVFNVNITGNDERDSIGVLIDGLDNTLTNMRIGHVFIGVYMNRGATFLRNIHPLYYTTSPTYPEYNESIGFYISPTGGRSWFENCYSDNFATGFRTASGKGFFTNCYCFWYSGDEERHVAFASDVPFDGRINGLEIGGRHLPDHPIQFAENLTLTKNGIVEGIHFM